MGSAQHTAAETLGNLFPNVSVAYATVTLKRLLTYVPFLIIAHSCLPVVQLCSAHWSNVVIRTVFVGSALHCLTQVK